MNNNLKNKVKYKISMYKFNEENKNIKEKFKYKKLAYICGALLLTFTTIVSAKSIIRLFGFNAPNGVNVAVENGYLEVVNTDYKKLNDDIKIKVNSFLVDKYNMDINFEVDSSKYNINDGIIFNDLVIGDENNNIIFDSSKHNLSYANSIENNNIHLTIYADDIPSIKVLIISLSDITINDNTIKGNDVSFSLNVPEVMQSRDTTKYNVVSSNISNANFEVATMSNTALKIKFSNGNSDYKLLENSKDIWNIPKDNNVYIELNDGTRVDLARRSDGDGVSITKDIIEFVYTFNLTNFEKCDNFKLHIDDMIINYTRVGR
ncbi:MAG: DUF4179 domain-containing protein [Bacilli bacterium]|nr:DUF4179 domain-containing protein [Bacilli bacterium]